MLYYDILSMHYARSRPRSRSTFRPQSIFRPFFRPLACPNSCPRSTFHPRLNLVSRSIYTYSMKHTHSRLGVFSIYPRIHSPVIVFRMKTLCSNSCDTSMPDCSSSSINCPHLFRSNVAELVPIIRSHNLLLCIFVILS